MLVDHFKAWHRLGRETALLVKLFGFSHGGIPGTEISPSSLPRLAQYRKQPPFPFGFAFQGRKSYNS
jgi:hypothetical protein